MKKLFVWIVLVLISASAADAKTLYVDAATGNDSTAYAANDSTNKWATLGRALWGDETRTTPNASQAATAGDTVLVTAGTYTAPDTGTRFGVIFNPVNSGTSDGARIVIRAVGTVELRSTGTAGGPLIGADGKHYITWDGFYINEANSPYLDGDLSGERSMCMFHLANYGNVLNSTFVGLGSGIANANQAAIFYYDVVGGRAYNNTISNVKATGTNVGGIYTYYATSTANPLIIEHNYIHDSTGGVFLKGGSQDGIIVRFNLIHDVEAEGVRLAGSGGVNSNHLVYQNVIYNAKYGILAWSGVGAGTGNKIVNNTLYNLSLGGFGHGAETGVIQIFNNIVHTAPNGTYSDVSGAYISPHSYEHNLYYSVTYGYDHESIPARSWATWTTSDGKDSNTSPYSTYSTDPLFVSIPLLNFKLQAGSPAAALGVDILDLDGDGLTNDLIPAGAYITGNEQIGIETALPSATGCTISGATPGQHQCSSDYWPVTPVTMACTTDIAATCKYDDVDTTYTLMDSTFSTTGTTAHSQSLTANCGQSYTYYVRCSSSGADMLTSYPVSFALDKDPPPRKTYNITGLEEIWKSLL